MTSFSSRPRPPSRMHWKLWAGREPTMQFVVALCQSRQNVCCVMSYTMTAQVKWHFIESLGTVPATHFHKYCQNHRKGCKFVQYYGYYKSGSGSTYYFSNWIELPYFLSSQETGFEMKMLQMFDIELLVGQLSYKQKADIYNISNGYDTTKKECSTIPERKETHVRVHG